MVEGKGKSSQETTPTDSLIPKVNIAASAFVGKTSGKLKDYYRIGKVLGTGAFGEVRMCVHRESGA